MPESTSSRLLARRLLGLEPPESYHPTAVERRELGVRSGIAWHELDVTTIDGDAIPCILLLPERPSGANAIAVHQHAGVFALGKSEPAGLGGDPALAYGLRLAERGVRVLIPDLLGFEGRRRGWTEDDAADERLDALIRVTNGDSLQAKHTRDIAALTSWLAEGYGDERGIGIMGHSLGGQVALFSLAVDPRLTAGVISCGLGTLASFAEHRIAHNPSWFVPGLGAAGDAQLLAAALADQRVLVSAGTEDGLFPIDGVHAVIDSFAPGVCTAEVFRGGHSLPAEVMERALDLLAGPR